LHAGFLTTALCTYQSFALPTPHAGKRRGIASVIPNPQAKF